jgi:hypothetical protein
MLGENLTLNNGKNIGTELANVRCKQRKEFANLQGGFMGSLLSKEIFYLALCLITLFSLASCASSKTRKVAVESEVKRSPPGDARIFQNKIVSRQYSREKY